MTSACFVCRVALQMEWDNYVKAHMHVCPRCGRRYSGSYLREARSQRAAAFLWRWGTVRAAKEGRR